jgi:hypothetical protein
VGCDAEAHRSSFHEIGSSRGDTTIDVRTIGPHHAGARQDLARVVSVVTADRGCDRSGGQIDY